jgi:hypothetical protein
VVDVVERLGGGGGDPPSDSRRALPGQEFIDNDNHNGLPSRWARRAGVAVALGLATLLL